MRWLLPGLLTLAYPALVYLSLGHLEPRWLALLLVALALLRAAATRDRMWLLAAAGGLLLAGGGMISNALMPLQLYPVLVNAVLLVVFGSSLVFPPTVIERLARLREPDLPEAGVRYTRKVTWLWCGFFACNGGIALGTALWASPAVWALYNGVIAYLLMGLLFAGEWLVRQRVRAGYRHG